MLQVLLVLLAVICAVISAQLNEFYSESELNVRKNAAKKYLLEPTSSEEAYCHARTLQVTETGKLDCDCNGLEKLVRTKSVSPLDVYYGLQTAAACDCNVTPLRSIEDQIEEDLKSNNINIFGGAALAAKMMNSEFMPNTDDLVGKLTALMQPSGLFRSVRTEVGSSNIANTKFALEILSQYAAGRPEMVEVATTVTKLLTDVENQKVSDPTLIASIVKITSGNKKPILAGEGATPAERLSVISNGLLSLRHASGACKSSAVIESLVIVMSYTAQPLYVGLEAKSFVYSKNAPKTSVQVKNALGKYVSDATIQVLALRKEGRETVILTGELEGGVLDLSAKAADMTPGRYSAELSVTLADRKQAILTTVFFAVQGRLVISDVSAGINKNKESSDVDLDGVAEPNTWSEENAYASKNEYVHVQFTVSTPKKTGVRFAKPHQVFVKFTHVSSGTSSFFVASGTGGAFTGKGSGSGFSVSVSLNKEAKTFLHLSGAYTVSVLAADPAYDAVEYIVGSVDLTFPQVVEEEPALYVRSLLHHSDNTLKPIPEVSHKMRAPPTNAPVLVSAIFTVLAIVPLVLFIGYIISLKANLQYMRSYWTHLFAGGIISVCVMYALYWFTVPGFLFYDTIKYLCFAFPIMGFVGRNAVISAMEERQKNDSTNSK